MKGFWFVSATAVAAGLCWAPAADAASTYTLCSTGPGKPLVSPATPGTCAHGQSKLALASAGTVSSLQSQVNTLTSELNSLKGTLQGVTRNGNLLTFSGMNVEVNSGLGATNGDPSDKADPNDPNSRVNGLGNLIVGYDDLAQNTTGSNNLVVGDRQDYESYGGIIAGQQNEISGPYAAVTGGIQNLSSAADASVTGGYQNKATALYASVTGGFNNTASAQEAAVTGGRVNTASGQETSVTGGSNNTASTQGSVVTGGSTNTASGLDSSIAGGEFNIAHDPFSFIGAGCDNLTGSDTQNTNACDPGGEALLGGASVTLTGTDMHSP